MTRTAMARKGLRTALLACSVLVLASSCDRKGPETPAEQRETVSFVINSPSTRAAVTPYESRVSSLDVLVFRSDDGTLDGYGRSLAPGGADLDGISVEVTAGVAHDWYVVANAPSGTVSSYTRKSSFLEGLTQLTHGTQTSLVMVGSGHLSGNPGQGAVSVALDRYACKVTVRNLVVDWPDAFGMGPVTLGRIVLVNVVATTPWSAVPAAGTLWYNKAGLEAGLPAYVQDMLVKDYGGLAVPDSNPVNVESPLYCMPNPVSNNDNAVSAPAWSPRPTRVAVELTIGGTSNWYPVTLPQMACTRHYVTGPGSIGPDYPVERSDMRFDVLVEQWREGTVVPSFGD